MARTDTPIPLTQLTPGARAVVVDRQVGCDDCEVLSAMGLTDGCSVKVCRGGANCIIEVARTRLGISSGIARRILVRLAEQAA